MSDIELGIVDYTVKAEVYEEVGGDFDTEAVDDAVLAALNAQLPAGLTVTRSGHVRGDESLRATAEATDWRSLLDAIDLDSILASHGR
ncbi:hypothetical protein HQQ80_16690 [Microbacteriaceae bacterium VKM Ac-2855]|nr:hypothetical protein [Microbacteriaceae bacterium VKM Ac-2855]